jgi:hypothetical protein
VRRLALPIVLAATAACAAAGPASAQAPDVAQIDAQSGSPAGPVAKPGAITAAQGADLFWATVNICDTAEHPNALGVRGSMPGNGRRQRMFMRFTAQYWSGREQAWKTVGGAGVSPWVHVGSARYVSRQMGWTFVFAQPATGITFTMRGVVEYEWRKGDRVLKRKSRVTKTGVEDVDGGDPPNLSKAMCLIY